MMMVEKNELPLMMIGVMISGGLSLSLSLNWLRNEICSTLPQSSQHVTSPREAIYFLSLFNLLESTQAR